MSPPTVADCIRTKVLPRSARGRRDLATYRGMLIVTPPAGRKYSRLVGRQRSCYADALEDAERARNECIASNQFPK